MANFNKVLLLGNLTRDPQLSYLPSQTAVVEFGIAVNRRWTGQNGDQREETCFVDCRAFGRSAENLNKYCKKGDPLFVEGRLTYDTWTAQDGSKRSKHRVTVQGFQFLSRAGDSSAAPARAASGAPSAAPAPEDENQAGPDDDIPF